MDFSIGDRVSLLGALSYLKTADPMPMLRPPDLISANEIGVVVGFRANETAEVRFRRGTFLLSTDSLVINNSSIDE